MPDLPIDVIPDTRPPRFRWRQRMDGLVGRRTTEYEGVMPASAEDSIIELIALAKAQAREVASLKKRLEGALETLAEMSSRSGGVTMVQPEAPPNQPTPNTSSRKGGAK